MHIKHVEQVNRAEGNPTDTASEAEMYELASKLAGIAVVSSAPENTIRQDIETRRLAAQSLQAHKETLEQLALDPVATLVDSLPQIPAGSACLEQPTMSAARVLASQIWWLDYWILSEIERKSNFRRIFGGPAADRSFPAYKVGERPIPNTEENGDWVNEVLLAPAIKASEYGDDPAELITVSVSARQQALMEAEAIRRVSYPLTEDLVREFTPKGEESGVALTTRHDPFEDEQRKTNITDVVHVLGCELAKSKSHSFGSKFKLYPRSGMKRVSDEKVVKRGFSKGISVKRVHEGNNAGELQTFGIPVHVRKLALILERAGVVPIDRQAAEAAAAELDNLENRLHEIPN